ncbi:MAG: hypothetical protein A3J65_02045 [Candidatus Buchananbacteria bacterium RIFCSPHIGHO2_02_FULL_45_11b]|uniref:Xylose isomerase-like TIM barrel domain-containing protein n=4 Tax=Candidatus Buchananiibacteriota TaxID=1817903 RepID=A0A1G1Y117_9BACT|nr:MAG: hypothetical protein A2663_00385 [Candidatus Buchananbacteria bacterium RIFCSPHIGHO2_01_FULL_46_12]OGY51895.1 MAG: hypothetical protein A3J65_02045 [Candidatus Buchananbacteria bacterium RIFCSPHIGHO2_02_FULL_45_11b]OGY54173.1 MAG: hypothetical protein A3B15_01045 [Candidatus Buchananbacteria bacterium RIFCSPLOWO2_01_FULL_45_31]OGY57966.1 MAG: hypothetical protein A3H67_01740 [Candidatus Buchananbacteria bacterium RIFCSPLOWO2_02_FULL_46_11b]
MTEIEILKRIYPSAVTFAGDWQKQMAEVKNLKLKEISLFLTCANFSERQEIYQALKKTSVKSLPHVHLRHDMKEPELDFLVKNYKTKAFTLHYQCFNLLKNSKHKKKIFIEINDGRQGIKDVNLLKKVGGVCLDLSHLEQFRWHNPKYHKKAILAADKFKIGCNHLSAVRPGGKSRHLAGKISELDYVKNIPRKYFSQYINLELGNSIKQQLKFKKYVAKLLFRAWKS